jgi:hypothetical protein
MKEFYRKIKTECIVLFLPIFIIIFIISSTNTIGILGGLSVYYLTLILIIAITIYSDKKLNTNFKRLASGIFIVSIISTLCGFLTFPIQEKLNFERAEKFIIELENFKKKNNKYPENQTEIEFPKSRNGLLVERFEYFVQDNVKDGYVLKYFDGFWNKKVYVSNSKKWFTDD